MTLSSTWAYLSTHLSAGVGLIWLILSAINGGLRKADPASRIGRFLDGFLDVISPFTRSDSPGTWKLPGTLSRAPGEQPKLVDTLPPQSDPPEKSAA